jgi:hypothetical protein
MPPKGVNVSRVGHTNDTSGKSHNAKLLSRNSYKFIFTPVSSVNTPPDTIPSISQEQQLYAAATALIEGLQNLETTQFDTSEVIERIEATQLNLETLTSSLGMVLEEFSFPDLLGLLNSSAELQMMLSLNLNSSDPAN